MQRTADRAHEPTTPLDRRSLLRRAGGGLAAALTAAGLPSPPLAARTAVASAAPVVREFELVAEEFDHEVSDGTTVRAWGYNGQMPGPELRVREGDRMLITLHNKLPVPTTIHWHGINLRPEMDGVAGLSQAAVEPGGTFVYDFTATPAGSRWYHSHTDPALQVPLGLYGPLVVEPREPLRTYDRDYTYFFAEWDMELTPEVAAGDAPRGPGDRMLRGGELGSDLFLMNGRSHGLITPITLSDGERVLIRLMNAGHMSHVFHTHGHSFKIVATDGNPVPVGMEWTKDTLHIGPAERYDLELTGDNPGVWMVHCHMEHHMANGMMTLIQYDGHRPTGPAADFFEPAAARAGHGGHAATGAMPEPSQPAEVAVGDTAEVEIRDDRFAPVELSVAAGTVVAWVNKGADWHSVAAFDGAFESGRIAPGDQFEHRFDEHGRFRYLCKHHGLQGMIGTVNVT